MAEASELQVWQKYSSKLLKYVGVFVSVCPKFYISAMKKRSVFFESVIQYLQHKQDPICKTVKQGRMCLLPEFVFILFSFHKQC